MWQGDCLPYHTHPETTPIPSPLPYSLAHCLAIAWLFSPRKGNHDRHTIAHDVPNVCWLPPCTGWRREDLNRNRKPEPSEPPCPALPRFWDLLVSFFLSWFFDCFPVDLHVFRVWQGQTTLLFFGRGFSLPVRKSQRKDGKG